MKNFLALTVFLTALAADAARFAQPDRPFTFEFDEFTWEVVATPKAPAQQDVDRAMEERTLATVQRKKADDKYHARFSVVVDDPAKIKTKGKTPLGAYLKHAVDFLESQRFRILSTESVRLPGVPGDAYEVVAHQRDFGLTFRQVIFLAEREDKPTAYLLTAATRTNKYEAYKGELDALFKSFSLKR